MERESSLWAVSGKRNHSPSAQSKFQATTWSLMEYFQTIWKQQSWLQRRSQEFFCLVLCFLFFPLRFCSWTHVYHLCFVLSFLFLIDLLSSTCCSLSALLAPFLLPSSLSRVMVSCTTTAPENGTQIKSHFAILRCVLTPRFPKTYTRGENCCL